MWVEAKKNKRLLLLAEEIFRAKALFWYKETELMDDFYPNSLEQVVYYLRKNHPDTALRLWRDAIAEARRM